MAYMIPPNGNFCLRHARQVLPVACEYAPQVLLPYSHFTIAMLSPCVHHPHGMAFGDCFLWQPSSREGDALIKVSP